MKSSYISKVKDKLEKLYHGQTEYLQAIEELIEYSEIEPYLEEVLVSENLLERLLLPDRVICFNVAWVDDQGEVQVNQGWRVQHSNLIGPYKGGVRFHPNVNESVLKFLALEQTFKNALTGLPIGGAKGGSNFDPKGKTRREVMRFCQAFMDELSRYIGPNTDIPAGDINVGTREIGYMFGRYRRLQNQFSGAMTGKSIEFGGSQVRVESTGYGVIYFVEKLLEHQQKSLDSMKIIISGSGNVALHTAKKAIEKGAVVLTLSNSKGYCYRNAGFTQEMVDELISNESRPKLDRLAEKFNAKWFDNDTPWEVKADIAIPCATQNELGAEDAKHLIDNDIQFVLEGANMPCTAKAVELFEGSKVVFAPAKAVNSGGVVASTLEMGQNAIFYPESFDLVSDKLKNTMGDIHDSCISHNESSYLRGANSATFSRLIIAMAEQGV
ncbi:glutamate dehydrogenase [Thalassotalea insulae]|uniref:Glutamate dehydrogenase n=1 Tax=Thalassotalea insulae TaxID=2056778 RepID=A0ABQ6GWQ7_9GAMM|nr:NADP-specific glutamate dehydrogenase [Thalassotalea insulae]GLX79052.1 glutamate dehydrogenase [Thalassotalea insulae]